MHDGGGKIPGSLLSWQGLETCALQMKLHNTHTHIHKHTLTHAHAHTLTLALSVLGKKEVTTCKFIVSYVIKI